MPRNGNGTKGGDGGRGSVPRWVRTLFDQHEARMAAHESRMAAHEEAMAAHEDRMDRMDRELRELRGEAIEARRQTREIVAELARLDAQRAKDGRALVEALKDMRGRVNRLERK